MKIKAELRDLQEINNLLLTLVPEAKFEFKKEGLSVSAVDPSHVAMIVINVSKDGFLEYDVEEDTEVGIDLDKMKEILKLGSKGDVVDIVLEDSRLTYTIGDLVTSMSTIDTSGMSIPKVPELSLPARAVVPLEDFELALKSAHRFSDHIVIKITPESFEMYSEGESDATRMVLSKEKLRELDCEEEVRSIYPIEYLVKLVKHIDTADFITVSMSTDYPIKIDFEIVKGHGTASFLLAPRIEE